MDWADHRRRDGPGDIRHAHPARPFETSTILAEHHCVYRGALDIPGDEQWHRVHLDDGSDDSGSHSAGARLERVLQPAILDSALCTLLRLRDAADRPCAAAFLLHSVALPRDLLRNPLGIFCHRPGAGSRNTLDDGAHGDYSSDCLRSGAIARPGPAQPRVSPHRDLRGGDGGCSRMRVLVWLAVRPGSGLGLPDQASCSELAELCPRFGCSHRAPVSSLDCREPKSAEA
jgi:hypothetical protein